MKSKLVAALLIASTLVAAPAIAREAVPIVNYDNIAVAVSNEKAASADKVKQAIQAAAAAKGWSVATQADGKLLATLEVRGKHSITVEIAYSAEKYSLTYKDSSNMKYGTHDAQAVIHPFYNKWVLGLKEAIRLELLKV